MAESPNLILLKHADHKHIFYFDRALGRYTKGSNRDLNMKHSDGLAFEYKFGLWHRERVFCALFIDDATLWLRVGATETDICDSRVSLQMGSGPLVRTFEVRKDGDVVVACRYWIIIHKDPEEDLFACACDIARDPVTLEETRKRWMLMSGRGGLGATAGA